MCFSQKIFYFIILLFIFMLLVFYNVLLLCCSIDCKYMNIFCTTRTSNVFFSNPYFFKLAHVLVDRLTWNLEEMFTGCTFIARTTDFKIWYFFFFFFTSKCCHFFNFRNFAVPMVRAIAIFILIKIHLIILIGAPVGPESRQPFEPVFKNMLYLRLHNFHNFR